MTRTARFGITLATLATAATFAVLAVLVLPARAFAQGRPDERTLTPDAAARVRSVLIGAASGYAEMEPSLLPLAEEQKVERARHLIRAGYPDQAERMLAEVEETFPTDLDVLLARAELLARRTPGEGTLRFLEENGRKPAISKALQERTFRGGFWLRYEAEALAQMSRISSASERALKAWERSPEQAAWARTRLESWSGGDVDHLARDVGKLADRHPDRPDLVLEAASYEGLMGKERRAIARVRKAEDRARAEAGKDAKRGAQAPPGEGARADLPAAPDALLMGDPASFEPLPGSLLWQLALSLRARDEDGTAADSVFVELALGDYDPGIQRNAVRNLFEDRSTVPLERMPGGPSWVVPLRERERERQRERQAAQPNAEKDRLLALERVWRDLPRTPDTVRLGLELADRFTAAGDDAGAARISKAAAELAARTPGAEQDTEVAGRLALERGDAALASGDLDAAVQRYIEAGTSGAGDLVREEAAYRVCDVLFYEVKFDSAGAMYDAFARAFPGSRHANDALERAYLIESGEGGPVAGLPELANALRLEHAAKWDEALEAGREAARRAGESQVWSHAGLLVASVLASQGRTAEAAQEALAVAEGRPDDRLAPMARRKAGDLFHAQGQDTQALAQYEELLVRYPRSWLAPETRRLVQNLRAKAGNTP